MKTRVIMTNTNGIISVETFEGETIEEKVERIVTNKEPISDGAPMIYTEKSAGVLPAYNIRTDRFDIAIDATSKIEAARQAKREAFAKEQEKNGTDVGEPNPN